MMTKIFKLLSLAALFLSFQWMMSNSDWEPKIAFIGSLIAFLSLEFKGGVSKPNPSDLKLFEEFLTVLPSGGDIAYIKDRDMAAIIDPRWLDQLRRFLNEWDNAEHEFSKKSLEKKRTKLLSSIALFFDAFAEFTFPCKGNYQRVPPDWQLDRPAKYDHATTMLNTLARAIYDSHQTLIRACIKRLYQ